MKQFYLIVFAIIISQIASSTVIISNQNGSWKTASTWDLNRVPMNGDTIVIPTGKVVVLGSSATLSNAHLKIAGTLRFGGLFTALNLDNTSSILVGTAGRIEATLDFVQYLIFNGQFVFYAQHLVGPLYAAPGSAGFQGYDPLPVKFAEFTATVKNSADVVLNWSTAAEINSNMYQVERSFDGAEWNTIAYVSSIGNSSEVNKYSYTDKKVPARTVHYRIRQVDIDGKFMFTDIRTIRTERKLAEKINITAAQNGKVLIQFADDVKGSMIVRFVSLGGQVLDEQIISNPEHQLLLSTRSHLKGNYIVSVSNGKDLQVARQVIL